MTLFERWQRRLAQAIHYVWENRLEELSRLPRAKRDRAALQMAMALAKSNGRFKEHHSAPRRRLDL